MREGVAAVVREALAVKPAEGEVDEAVLDEVPCGQNADGPVVLQDVADGRVRERSLGGYVTGYRFPDLNGDVIVTLPPTPDKTMLCVEAKFAKKVLWVDVSNTTRRTSANFMI